MSMSAPRLMLDDPIAKVRFDKPVAPPVDAFSPSFESTEIVADVDTTTPFPRSDDNAKVIPAPFIISVLSLPDTTAAPALPDTETSA